MAKRILIAVDRTTAPDALLDLVGDLVRAGGATVRLLHVAPAPNSILAQDGRVLAYADQETFQVTVEVLDALRALEVRLPPDAVESMVRFGDPAAEILAEADEFDADLIAMPVTCKRDIRRAVCGSVAEKVARRAPMAVLLLRSAE